MLQYFYLKNTPRTYVYIYIYLSVDKCVPMCLPIGEFMFTCLSMLAVLMSTRALCWKWDESIIFVVQAGNWEIIATGPYDLVTAASALKITPIGLTGESEQEIKYNGRAGLFFLSPSVNRISRRRRNGHKRN